MIRIGRLMLLWLVLCAPGALAARLEIPLRVPLESIRQALDAELAASPARPDVVYRDGPCRYLTYQAPRLEAAEGRLRLIGPGSAALGAELLGKCQSAAWEGSIEFVLAPRIDNAGRLRMRIVDSRLSDGANRRGLLGFAWDLSKRYIHPRLERFSYDIGASRSALLSVVRHAAPPEQVAAMDAALNALQVLEPRVEATQVVVPIAMDLPDAWLAAPAPLASSAAPLTEAEIEALEKAMEPWDAFLVYSVRQLALDSPDSALHKRLFTLLLESRYQLLAILSGDAPAGADPVRTLFLDTWEELRRILADAQHDRALGASALRYALFVDSGDALLALERAAPGLGMRPSADSLRELARALRPGATDDPLAFSWVVDPQLRQLFDVEDIPDPQPAPAEPPPQKSWLDLFIGRAFAGDAAGEAADLPALDRWIPTQQQLPAYEMRIGGLLQKTSARELAGAELAPPYAKVYRDLVPTTALIESCWRQYVVRASKVSYLRSPAGSVGIMQINQHVWRGFYSIERLRWDTAYNIRAGAQILLRYVKDYAAPYAERQGDARQAARAAYAVYNAGPRAVGRFAKAARHPREARVDDRLWTLYQGIAAGGEVDLASCAVKPTKTALLR
jgi:Transglycosylase SLT domain